MSVRRLDDAELGRRVRARNLRANEAHRARLVSAGKRQTNLWMSASLREQLDTMATDQGAPLAQIIEQVLIAGLLQPQSQESFYRACADLADAHLDHGADIPAGYRHGVDALLELLRGYPRNKRETPDFFREFYEKAERSRIAALDAAILPPSTEQDADHSLPVDAKPPAKNELRDALIGDLKDQGKSYGQISAAMAEEGYFSENGNPLSNSTIGNVLKKRDAQNKENSLDRRN